MEELIRRCQQGDRASMGQLYTAMHDELLLQCRIYTDNDSMAEDLLHDAFLLIFTNIEKLRSPEKGRQWMHKVVKNVCLLYRQSRQNLNLLSMDDVREKLPTQDMETALTYDTILNAIEQLPNGYRQVFRLSVLEGLTHQQIAELLGIQPHTSSSQLLRAKRQLRQALQMLLLTLFIAIPLGTYYFWSVQEKKNRASMESSTEKTVPASSHIETETGELSDYNIINEKKKQLTAKNATEKNETEESEKNTKPVQEKVTVQQTGKGDITDKSTTLPQRQISVSTQHPTPTLTQKTTDMEAAPYSLSLAYSGLPNGAARQLPFGAEGMNGEIDSVTHYHLPISVVLNAHYRLGKRWWLDGGLRYTRQSSETRVGNTYLYLERQQRVHYLGVSLGIGYQLWQHRRWKLYTTASVLCELPLHSSTETSYWQDGLIIDRESGRLSPRPQWSIGAGFGLQFDLTPSVGFFAEPSLQYYFHNSDGINTWSKEHSFTPMLPFGIRISF